MPEYLKQCPICESSKLNSFLKCQDYTVSQQQFQLVCCEKCSFTFTNPRPTEEEIGNYYHSEDYISHSNTSRGLINWAYQQVRKYTLRKKIALIQGLEKKVATTHRNNVLRILDIGCGTGKFLRACHQEGWHTYGTEPDSKAREKAIINSQCEVQADFLNSFLEEKFQIITLWHVLEHIHQLHSTVEKLSINLEEGGYLIIAVPNLLSLDAKKYQQYWAAYDVPRHLYHFSPSSIKELFGKFGFKIVAVKPMVFDAFYISLLSSKYRTGKTRYVEAIWTGLMSNIWAAKNDNNYSSLIYLLRK